MLLFAIGSLQAQSSFENVWDSTFRYIKQNGSMGTTCLWDLGMPDSSIYDFKGSETDSPANFEIWGNFYEYFRKSAINPGAGVAGLEEIRKKLDDHFRAGVYALPVLYARAGKIKRSALQDGIVYFDSTEAAWRSKDDNASYERRDVFIACSYVSTTFKPELNLLFSDEFFISNTGLRVSRVDISLRNENWRELEKNLPYKIVLLPGENLLRIGITMSDGSVMNSRIYLILDGRDLSGGVDGKHSFKDPFHFGDETGSIYEIPVRDTEFKDKLGAFIDYLPGYTNGVMNTCIRKPLLIIEGIDFGFRDHPTGMHGGKCGNIGLIDLKNGYILNPYASRKKDMTEHWEPIVKAPRMLDDLRNRGYDVYYIDFHNGAEYMENNAMLVVKLIKMLNARKCGNDELVVIGTSMGGIVGRYALSYMEKNKIPHCVRTFLAFDAPHQGANIPLGFQAFMRYYKGVFWPIEESFNRKIDRAATRQLLIYHILSEYNTSMHRDRKDFNHKLKELGNYPRWSRNIALINGSINRSFQNFNSGDPLLKLLPVNTFMTSNPFKLGATVYAMSKAYRQDEAMVLQVFYPAGLDYIEKCGKFSFCPDNVPGSIRYDLKEARRIYAALNLVDVHSSACFIPSYSSLDLRDPKVSEDIVGKLDSKKPNPDIYPFHTYSGVMNTNEEHMMITDANTDWAIAEIEKNRNELPPVLSGKYNFGRYERFSIGSVTISNNSVLQINGNYKNGFGNGNYDYMNTAGSKFEIFTSDCNAYIVADRGGSLIIGDRNTPVNNKGIMRIRSGSVLVIKSGGKLHIHNGSQLLIEEGATLVYYKDAEIILDGDDAMLQIDGKLRLEEGAVFSLSKGESQQSGFLKFRNAKGGYGNASIETGGGNASIDLKGYGKNTDLLLQVEGELNCKQGENKFQLISFKISNCKVNYGNNSRIIVATEFYADEVIFDKLEWANKGSSDAVLMTNHSVARISNCEFNNLASGIKVTGSSGKSNQLEVKTCKFKNCINGINLIEAILSVGTSLFENCSENGIYTASAESDIRIEGSSFIGNETGIYMVNKTHGADFLFIQSCQFIRNISGLKTGNIHSAVSCSNFLNNVYGLNDEFGEISLSLGKYIVGSVYTLNGGNNTFAYNSGAGIHLKATLLYLFNGNNNFLQRSGSMPCNFLKGELAHNTNTHGSSSPYKFKAEGNYWYPAPATNLTDGAGTHYFVSFPYPGSGGTTLNYFDGYMQSAINKVCYNPSSCNPCNYSEEISKQKGESFAADSVQISIWPFPVNDILNVWIDIGTNNENPAIRLIDLSGRTVAEQISDNGLLRIETMGLPEGIYVLEIVYESKVSHRKIIIKH